MKSIIVPKTSIPPAENTLVLQITKKEAEDLFYICEHFHQVAGHKTLASSSMIKHLEEFLSTFEGKKK